MLNDLTSRQITYDINVLSIDETLRFVVASYPEASQSAAIYMDHLPYNFEDRLVKLEIGSYVIDFLTPSIEDLVVMKLYAQRPNDLQDIRSAAQRNLIDWDVLEHLVYDEDEAKSSNIVVRRYSEMVDAFNRFKEEYKYESDV